MGASGEHFPCSPSQLERRALCPGSLRMEREVKDLPELPSEQAERGTHLHRLINTLLCDPAAKGLDQQLDELPDYDRAQLLWAAKETAALMKHGGLSQGADLKAEHYIDLACVHPAVGGGTIDLLAVEAFQGAWIIDYKFGWTPVAAKGNWQLTAYGAGVCQQESIAPEDCHLVIVQPALYRVDEAVLDPAQVTSIPEVVGKCFNSEAQLVPSLAACRYCKARGICPAQKKVIALPTHAAKERIDAMPIADVAVLLRTYGWADKVIGWMKERVFAALSAGQNVPGWELKPGREKRQWKTEPEALDALVKFAGEPMRTTFLNPTTLKTPAQVELALGKGKEVRDLVETLVERKAGESRMVEKVD